MQSKQARNMLRRGSPNLQAANSFSFFQSSRINLLCSSVKLRGSAAILTTALQVQTSQRSLTLTGLPYSIPWTLMMKLKQNNFKNTGFPLRSLFR
jgi:hypothetical protein